MGRWLGSIESVCDTAGSSSVESELSMSTKAANLAEETKIAESPVDSSVHSGLRSQSSESDLRGMNAVRLHPEGAVAHFR